MVWIVLDNYVFIRSENLGKSAGSSDTGLKGHFFRKRIVTLHHPLFNPFTKCFASKWSFA